MRAALAALALGLAGCVHTPPQPAPPSQMRMDLEAADGVRDALEAAGFRGQFSYSGPSGLVTSNFELMAEPATSAEIFWPWASVTKQVLAVMVMQEVEAGRIVLDESAATYLPALASDTPPTVRQLLQHRSGLRNPDDTPTDANGVPNFYTTGPTGLDWCIAERGEPGGDWAYNNCDYIVLGALLEAVNGESIDTLLAQRIGAPLRWRDTRLLGADEMRDFVGGDADYAVRISRYGASAGLVGPLAEMLRFDRALLDGELLGDEALSLLWDSDPALGYMALGQWVFDAPLAGCDAPVRIVERRGAIGKYQLRNIILPEQGTVLALATDHAGFDFGEIWTGSGAMHDVLAAAACG